MTVLDPTSLMNTVNTINHRRFFDEPISADERTTAARWIAARRGLPGAYAGMFAPMPTERSYRLFTGERVQSAAARHVAGEEACRALRILAVDDAEVVAALDAATERMVPRLRDSEQPGVF